MPAFKILCILLHVFLVLADDEEYNDIIVRFDHEIGNDIDAEEEEADLSACKETRTNWDKLFIMLENSQMKENMLLQSFNDILMVELQSMRTEMLRFVGNFAATCSSAMDSVTSSIMSQLDRKLGMKIQHIQQAKLTHEAEQGKILAQLLKMNQDLVSKLNNLETTWQSRVLTDTQTSAPFLQQNSAYTNLETMLNLVVDQLQERRSEQQYSQERLAEHFLLAGCEMALVFPMRSKKIFGSVQPVADMTLSSFTACVWAKATDILDKTILISYGTKRNPYEIQLYLSQESAVLSVGGDEDKLIAENSTSPREWTHFCGTWSSNEGHATLWVNGQNAATSFNVAEGHTIPDGGILQLGQEKNGCCVGGGFDEKLAFSGKLTGFNIWDRVLSEEEILNLSKGERSCESRGNVVGWGVTEILPHGGAAYVFTNH